MMLDPRLNHQWKRREDALLGKMPNAAIARKLGIDKNLVGARRRGLGIPPVVPTPRIQWTDEMIQALGKDTDEAIAKKFGVGVVSVVVNRRSLNIPPFKESIQTNQ